MLSIEATNLKDLRALCALMTSPAICASMASRLYCAMRARASLDGVLRDGEDTAN